MNGLSSPPRLSSDCCFRPRLPNVNARRSSEIEREKEREKERERERKRERGERRERETDREADRQTDGGSHIGKQSCILPQYANSEVEKTCRISDKDEKLVRDVSPSQGLLQSSIADWRCTCFGGTYTKIGTIQRRLAWPLRKDDTQIREAFHIFWWRRSGQSVTASDFGSNGPRFESGRGRCVESLDKALYSHLSQGEAFTLASISYLAILVKYILAKKKKKEAPERAKRLSPISLLCLTCKFRKLALDILTGENSNTGCMYKKQNIILLTLGLLFLSLGWVAPLSSSARPGFFTASETSSTYSLSSGSFQVRRKDILSV